MKKILMILATVVFFLPMIVFAVGLSYSIADLDDIIITARPFPEPVTLLLLGSGLIGLAGLGRKKLFKN